MRIVCLVLAFLGLAFAQDRGDFIVAYEDAASQVQLEYARYLQQQKFLEGLVDKLNQSVALPYDIGVVAAPCGQPNAYWAPEQRTLVICYDLFEYMSQVFRGRAGSDRELLQKMLGAVEFIFYHELGHALIGTFNIPYTGRQEDAVDQFSSILLLNQGKAESALAGAEFFVSGSGGGSTPFWDEHSLDEQRFYDIVCLVFGSNPQAYGALIQREATFGMGGGGILPKKRAARCPQNFKEINNSWKVLIDTYIPAIGSQPAVTAKTGPVISVGQATQASSYSETFSDRLTRSDQRLEDGQFYKVYEIQLVQGQEVTFELSSTEFDTYLVVTGPNNETYFNDDAAENVDGYVSRLTLPIGQTGTYLVGVTSYQAGETGNFQVGVIKSDGVYDETVQGALSTSDRKYQSGQYYDAYQYRIEKGQKVSIVLSTIAFDAFLIITSPSGEEISNDDYENQFGLARVDFVAKETGDYTIYATSYEASETGNYQLSISDGQKPIATGQATTGQTSPNPTTSPTLLGRGSLAGQLSAQDNQLKDGSYADYYTLEAQRGQVLNVSVMSADFEAYVGLVKPNGDVLEANRSADGTVARLEVQADQAGTWYVIVTSAKPGQTGNYLVSFK